MEPSTTSYFIGGIILISVILDAWLILMMDKHFRQRGIPKDLKARLRYLRTEFPGWLFEQFRQMLLSFYQDLTHFPAGFKSPALILILALIPPMLALRNPWFNYRSLLPVMPWFGHQTIYIPDNFWIGFLCMALMVWLVLRRQGFFNFDAARGTSVLPEVQALVWQHWLGVIWVYFSMLGFGLIAVASLTMGHIPGWDLVVVLGVYMMGWFCWDFPFREVARAFRSRLGVTAAMLFAHLGMILFLFNTYGRSERTWMLDFLSLVAAANLLRYWRKVPAIYWVVSVALILFTWNINAWWFSVIGDEFNFFTYGREIVEQHNLAFIGEHIFNGQAVYGTHPYFSSLIQAVFMRIFGVANFGWRFSNPYLSALAIGFFYLFLKAFVPKRVALLAAFFLACSHYLMTFGKIGYNNLQAFFAFGLVFWLTARAIQTQRLSSFVLLGAGLGGCFYVYPAALYLVPLPLLLLLMYVPPRSKLVWGRWVILAWTFLVTLFPLLLQPAYWQTKVIGTFLNQPGLAQSVSDVVGHFSSNLWYAFFSFLYLPNETHFVVSAYVDPVTSALFLVGLAVLLHQLHDGFSRFLLLGLGFLLFFVGASHDRAYPPTTRMFLLLPWLAVFAAIGLAWLVEQMQKEGQSIRFNRGSLALLLTGMLVTNVFMAYELAYHRTDRYQVLESLSLKIAQRATQAEQALTMVYICGESWGVGGIEYLQALYGVPASPEQIVRVVVKDGMLPPESIPLLASSNTIAILAHGLQEEWLGTLEAELTALPKTSCDIKTSNGTPRFSLWFSGNLGFLCE